MTWFTMLAAFCRPQDLRFLLTGTFGADKEEWAFIIALENKGGLEVVYESRRCFGSRDDCVRALGTVLQSIYDRMADRTYTRGHLTERLIDRIVFSMRSSYIACWIRPPMYMLART